jgi:hypothetical protein
VRGNRQARIILKMSRSPRTTVRNIRDRSTSKGIP